jgi:hypothetical protein
MEVESIRFPPVGPTFRNQYLPGSRGVSTKNLYRANVYQNKGTHGIATVSLQRHVKERNINGYVMERGKNTYAYKLPKGFSTRELAEIGRTPRSGSIMRVVQQINEAEQPLDYNSMNQQQPQGDQPPPPNQDFAARRASSIKPMDVDLPSPMDVDMLSPQSEGTLGMIGGGFFQQPPLPQQVFEDRFVDAQQYLQDYDDEINRRLQKLQEDSSPVEYREADGQQLVFDTLAEDAQKLRDPFMLDQHLKPLPAATSVTIEEIKKAASKRRRSSEGLTGNVGKYQRGDDKFYTPPQSPPALPTPPKSPQLPPPGPAQPVIGKRGRRRSSDGGMMGKATKKVRETDPATDYQIPRNQVVQKPKIEQVVQRVVKRKRQVSFSDEKRKPRKVRTDKGPKYTADREVMAKAPAPVRRKSNEFTPAQSTRSKVKR